MLENLLYEDFTPMIIYFVFYMYTLSGFIVPKPPSFETVFCWTVSHFDTVRPSIFPTLRISENSLSIFALEFLVSGNIKFQHEFSIKPESLTSHWETIQEVQTSEK